MEATIAVILCCMALLGIAAPEDDVRKMMVEECIEKCPFSTLEGEMLKEENRLKLWTTFHHPREAFPHFLVVNYMAVGSDEKETYLWTSNSIYFVIPPHVFGLVSLFLGMLDNDHTGEVDLILHENCSCWLDGFMYFEDREDSLMNHLEILTEMLRDIGNVSGNPQSVSNYQYLSSAIRMGNISDVYQKGDNTFYSFIFVLPILAIITYIVLMKSKHKAIKKQMMKPKQHPTFAALIGLSLTITLYITVLDIIAVAMLYSGEGATEGIYISENSKNKDLKIWLSVSLAFEIFLCVLGECNIIWLFFRRHIDVKKADTSSSRSQTEVKKANTTSPSEVGVANPTSSSEVGVANPTSPSEVGVAIPSEVRVAINTSPSEVGVANTTSPSEVPVASQMDKVKEECTCKVVGVHNKSAEDDKYWWFLLFHFIPPIWCLSSHFGFILIAWSSFVRHSKSLTLFYIFGITVMFLVMRQTYELFVNAYYANLKLAEKQEEKKTQTQEEKKRLRKQKQETDGISVWVIVLLHGEGFILIGFFVYLIWGLWALPVTEIVEESPVYLYDSLQVVVVVLAILVSYQLISFKENKIKKVLEKDVNESLKNSRNTLSRILIELKTRPTTTKPARRRSLT